MQGNGTKIENCYFKYRCTKVWEDLVIIKGLDQSIRKCSDCKQLVYLVDNENDLACKVLSSQCISVTKSLAERIFDKRVLMSISRPLTGHVRFKGG